MKQKEFSNTLNEKNILFSNTKHLNDAFNRESFVSAFVDNGYVDDFNAKYLQGINFFSEDLKYCICTPKPEETKHRQWNEI